MLPLTALPVDDHGLERVALTCGTCVAHVRRCVSHRTSVTWCNLQYATCRSGNRLAEVQSRWWYMRGALEALDDDMTVTFLRHVLIVMKGYLREAEVFDKVEAEANSVQSSATPSGGAHDDPAHDGNGFGLGVQLALEIEDEGFTRRLVLGDPHDGRLRCAARVRIPAVAIRGPPVRVLVLFGLAGGSRYPVVSAG